MSEEHRTVLKFKHESQEFFDGTFVARGLTGDEARAKVEEWLVVLRAKAAARAMATLIHKGWFHGEIKADVYHYDTGDVNVQVILTDYGELNPLVDITPAICCPEKPEYCGGYCEDCFGG